MGDPLTPRRVLVVARWYPSHDDPGRGSFVADHVRVLVAAGFHVTVVSFDPAMLRGDPEARAQTGRTAAERWRRAVEMPEAVNVPLGSGVTDALGVADSAGGPVPAGVPGIPVARLPVVLDPGERPVDAEVEAHADPLLAFGTALAAREGLDLIHAHTAIPDGLAAARLADALGLPLIVTEHASLVREQLADPAARERIGTLVAPGRRLAAVSDHLARLLDDGLGLPAGTIRVVANVVPEELFPEPGPGETTARRSDGGELLWVGARKASKGTDVLLRAFAIARATRPDVRLRLVGRAPTDEEEARLVALAAELGVADAATFGPPLPRASVAAAMRRATLFVHPSPFETFGMVAAEALLVGLPVVATPSGVEAIVGTDGLCGEVAASCDPGDLASAILRALDRVGTFDPTVMRARVLDRCGAGSVLAATLAEYAAATASRSSRLPAAVSAAVVAGDAAAGSRPSVGAGEPSAGIAATSGAGASPEPGPAAASTSPTIPPDGRAIIVCLNRTVALRAIPRLPHAALASAVVVTGPPTRQAPDAAPATGTWRELDPAGAYRDRMAVLTTQAGTGMGGRVRALASASARHRERDAMAADREGWIAAEGKRALEAIRDEAAGPADGSPFVVADDATGSAGGSPFAVADDATGPADGSPFVVAVEAADVTTALPLLDAGVPLAPGGLRWLADRAWAREPAIDASSTGAPGAPLP